MREDDATYFRRRAADETLLAEQARCPQAVAAHYQLAMLYFDRADGCGPPQSSTPG